MRNFIPHKPSAVRGSQRPSLQPTPSLWSIVPLVQLGVDRQPRPRCGRPDQFHHHLLTHHRPPSPIHTDRREEPMRNPYSICSSPEADDAPSRPIPSPRPIAAVPLSTDGGDTHCPPRVRADQHPCGLGWIGSSAPRSPLATGDEILEPLTSGLPRPYPITFS